MEQCTFVHVHMYMYMCMHVHYELLHAIYEGIVYNNSRPKFSELTEYCVLCYLDSCPFNIRHVCTCPCVTFRLKG